MSAGLKDVNGQMSAGKSLIFTQTQFLFMRVEKSLQQESACRQEG